MSARQLSESSGLSASYVSKLERGELDPSLKAFARIAKVLEMSTPEHMFIIGLAGADE